MTNGATIWASCSTENLMRTLKLQKRATRVILDADTRANSVELFKHLNWLTFYDKVKLNWCTIVYKRFQGNCPPYILDILKCNADFQARSSSRFSQRNLVCLRYCCEREGGRSFHVSSCKLWNSLPPHIKRADQSVLSFKKELFNDFFDKYNEIDSSVIS